MKAAIHAALPRPAAYLAHVKALYENEAELRLLPWLCDPASMAIDVGAFTGTYAIGMSLFAGSVMAVEPQPRQAAALRRAMPSSVKVVEAALSDATGSATMRLSSPGGGSMSTLDARAGTGDWLAVAVRTLRMDELRTGPVGFVKIDAEGHEDRVLAGAAVILQQDRPNLLIEAEERNAAGSVGRITALLAVQGYDAFFVRRDRVLPISDFDLARDQEPSLLVGGQRRAYRDYINNFVFIHRDRGLRLPEALPSPWGAGVWTLARIIGIGS